MDVSPTPSIPEPTAADSTLPNSSSSSSSSSTSLSAAAAVLKRCASVPHIDLQQPGLNLFGNNAVRPSTTATTHHHQHHHHHQLMSAGIIGVPPANNGGGGSGSSPIGTSSVSRDSTSSSSSSCSASSSSYAGSTSSLPNIFAPNRTRRYSTSFSPLAPGAAGPRLTPRVSQLRQEECADISNSREVTHEREVHSALQISQSWEDLTLDAESWSVKSGGGGAANGDVHMVSDSSDLTNPLHVTTIVERTVGIGGTICSSPSPTSRTPIRIPPYAMSPSPTRRTFTTRRSASPCALRPSSLGPVKRKFELDDHQNSYSPPPFKKIYTDRGASPICQSPSAQLTCPSPDSTEGRCTPKLLLSKLCTNSSSSFSSSSSPSTTSAPSPSMEIQIDLPTNLNPPLLRMPHEPMATGSSSDDDDDPDNDVRPVERMEDIRSSLPKQIDITPIPATTIKVADDGDNNDDGVRLPPADISDVASTIKPSNGGGGVCGEATLEPMNLAAKSGSDGEALVTTSTSMDMNLVV